MTTVACKLGNGTFEIAADTFVSGGWEGQYPKFRIYKEYVYAAAGTLSRVQEFFDWVKATVDKGEAPLRCPLKKKTPTALLWGPKCGVILFDESVRGLEYTGEYAAIGSGEQYAYGALAMGANTKRAVEIAAKFDDGTKPPVSGLMIYFDKGKVHRVVD